MSNTVSALFTNIDINGLTLRNCFALAPMTRVSTTAAKECAEGGEVAQSEGYAAIITLTG